MLNVLRAYALADPDIGYTQASGCCVRRGCLLSWRACWRSAAVDPPTRCATSSPPVSRPAAPAAPLQGMNFLAGLLLTYLPGEAEAYVALSLLMRQRCLREMCAARGWAAGARRRGRAAPRCLARARPAA